jgi:hypothetical protein
MTLMVIGFAGLAAVAAFVSLRPNDEGITDSGTDVNKEIRCNSVSHSFDSSLTSLAT